MILRATLRASVDAPARLVVSEGASARLVPSSPIIIEEIHAEPYSGSYDINPSEEDQVLPTALTEPQRNITVRAVPANYGRLIWDGHILTVY